MQAVSFAGRRLGDAVQHGDLLGQQRFIFDGAFRCEVSSTRLLAFVPSQPLASALAHFFGPQ